VTELRGITWDHPRGIAPMRATAAMYERAHPNVHITWTVRSLQAFGDQSIEQLAAMYDLLVIDHPFVGAAARSGCLVALETRLPEAFLRAQAHESVGASYESYTYDGHQWALPIDAAAQVAAYRPDVLDARDLAVPGTWTHVFDLMRVVGGRHVALPLSPVNAICSFLSLCANQGMSPSVSGSDPRCLAPRPVEQIALDILRRFVAEDTPNPSTSIHRGCSSAWRTVMTSSIVPWCLATLTTRARAMRHMCAASPIFPPSATMENHMGLSWAARGWLSPPRVRRCRRRAPMSSGWRMRSVSGPSTWSQEGSRATDAHGWTPSSMESRVNFFAIRSIRSITHTYDHGMMGSFLSRIGRGSSSTTICAWAEMCKKRLISSMPCTCIARHRFEMITLVEICGR